MILATLTPVVEEVPKGPNGGEILGWIFLAVIFILWLIGHNNGGNDNDSYDGPCP
jgi:hypothetical protein